MTPEQKLEQAAFESKVDYKPFNLDEAPRTFAEEVAIKFGKHLLKEAAQNAKYKHNGLYKTDAEGTWLNDRHISIDKKSITDTINKYYE